MSTSPGAHVPTAAGVPTRRTPHPGVPRPRIAWPTVALAVTLLVVFAATAWVALTGRASAWITVPVHAAVCFAMFTVLHDATHRGAGRVKAVNEVLGRVAIPFVALYASFPLFRYIHLEHHKHVNEDPSTDPDAWVIEGPAWQLPPRWAVVDGRYAWFWFRDVRSRPRAEVIESLAVMVAAVGVLMGLAVTGHLAAFALVLLIPQRIALVVLAWWFDWLPHHGLEATNRDDRFQTTRNIVGLEALLTPLMFSQNYHLVHHLHPIVPFYRYLQAWRNEEVAYLDHEPPLARITGRPVTADEERARRGLVSPS
ncbi:fatty acid desaturase [Nitriliruptor alkaliphilus]|uniref:fatty acid desaturase n=1 Tax=Nitriliruptor alkaliphilus TaxID=427918 RepID=UPI000ADB4B91|nr:fatty acid desaturase [Nitriliruptor alkaliphilus]